MQYTRFENYSKENSIKDVIPKSLLLVITEKKRYKNIAVTSDKNKLILIFK